MSAGFENFFDAVIPVRKMNPVNTCADGVMGTGVK
jgi:hypothetical protein